MDDESSLKFYGWWLEADQKFDYFMVGLSGALAGYLGQGFSPEYLGWSPDMVELASILLFVAAVFAGLKRIEKSVHLIRVNYHLVTKRDLANTVAQAIRDGTPFVERGTDKVMAPDELKKHQTEVEKSVQFAKDLIDKIGKKSHFWYWVRTYALVVGLTMLIIARVWKAYL